MVSTCSAEHTCNYEGDCNVGSNCCDNDCARTTCLPNGLCGPQVADCRNGGTERCCEKGYVCEDDGICTCVPACGEATCGDDGCGGSCGSCDEDETCFEGACVCAPQCSGFSCGDDGCGGTCGDCDANEVCSQGQCVCVPDCTEPNGSDGCGGECPGCEPDDPDRCVADSRCQCLQRNDGSYLWAEDIIEMNCDFLGCPYDDMSGRDYECVGGDICILTCLCGA